MNLTHFSLCSGIGGIDLAFEWAGFETVAQCEMDEYASKVLAKNFKGVKNFGDIRAITVESLQDSGIKPGTVTVLSGGIPCQPYSLAGKGKGDADSRDLWEEYMRVSKLIKPKWCIVENTYGLYSRVNQRYFRRILDGFAEMGYTTSWGIWGACNVGAPHKRERVFIIARKIPDTASKRCNTDAIQRRKFTQSRRAPNERRIQTCRVQPERICCGISDTVGIGKEKGRKKPNEFERYCWWQVEPDVGRVANGVSARMDRLRCLGNAVVPQQVYPIAKAIAEIEQSLVGAAANE